MPSIFHRIIPPATTGYSPFDYQQIYEVVEEEVRVQRIVRMEPKPPPRCEYCRTVNRDGGDLRGNCVACGAPLPMEE